VYWYRTLLERVDLVVVEEGVVGVVVGNRILQINNNYYFLFLEHYYWLMNRLNFLEEIG